MKNMFTKKNLMPIIVLSVICIVSAALIGIINSFTSVEIEKQRLEAANAGKIEVLPGLDVLTMEEITPDDKYPEVVEKISKFDAGYVVETKVKGNATGMIVLVGIDNDGKVTGVKVLENGETPTYWADVVSVVTGKDGKYNGQTPETLQPEIVSGATNSSTGVYNAVKASLDAFVIAGGGEVEQEPEYEAPKSQREDSELITLAGELVSKSTGFTAVEFDAKAYDAKYLARLFKEDSGKGYVAYVVVMSSSYAGAVESETLVHIENSGKIKAVKKLACNISPSNPEYGYTAPTEDEVNSFYDRIPSNTSSTIDNVELVTNATNTSTNVKNSVKEALTIVGDIISKEMPTSEESVKELAKELIGATSELADITPKDSLYIKKLYKDNDGKGYVAYLINYSEKYSGRLETETLVHVGNNGKIRDLKKITWTNSSASGKYTPPTVELVDAFYTSLKGKTLADLQELAALENGNHGGLLVTKATVTSKDLLKTLIEALEVIDGEIKKDMPTSEEEVKNLIADFIGSDVTITEAAINDYKYVKKLYKLSGDNGYVAYTANFSEKYGNGRLETETLVHIGIDGKIKDLKKITWTNSSASGKYTPPTVELVDAFYASLKGKTLEELQTLAELENGNHGGLLVTKATITSKDLLKTLIEAVKAVNVAISNDMPTSEEQIFAFVAEMLKDDSLSFTNITPENTTFVRRIYRENSGKGFIAYLVVVNERYQRIETETIICVGNDGSIKDIKKLIWKTSDAGWGYEPPAENAENPMYESLKGKNYAALKALYDLETNDGQLVTNATTTSKSLINSIIEAVLAINEVRKNELPRSEADVIAAAQQMAGEGKTLTDITPDNSGFIKRLYRIDETNNYIAYLVVINDRYGRVESETMIYINEKGALKDISRLTWKTSDEGWGYVPPEESLVVSFYNSLNGKNLEDIKSLIALENNEDGLLVTNATTTSKSLLNAMAEALEAVYTPKTLKNLPRIIGISIVAACVAASAAVIIIKRRKNG